MNIEQYLKIKLACSYIRKKMLKMLIHLYFFCNKGYGLFKKKHIFFFQRDGSFFFWKLDFKRYIKKLKFSF